MNENLVVAIGDLHGHFQALEEIMLMLNQKFHLINDGFIDPNAVLISTGDSIDRGEHALQIINYFMKLGKDNSKNFKALMGNHELLALENFDRARSISHYENPSMNYYGNNRHGFNGGVDFLEEFGSTNKERFMNYVERMSRNGDIGQWMRNLLPKYEIEVAGKKILFVHAGIPKVLADRASIDFYIEKYIQHIAEDTAGLGGSFEKYSAPLIMKDGIFWDRSSRDMHDVEIQNLISNLGVDYIVTGHTPHKKVTVFGGRIIDIDVGMSPRYGSNTPAALVITPSGISTHYVNGQIDELAKFRES